VAIYPIYEARDTEEDKEAVSAQVLADTIPGAEVVELQSEIEHFAGQLQEGDILLFMGAGKIDAVARKFTKGQ